MIKVLDVSTNQGSYNIKIGPGVAREISSYLDKYTKVLLLSNTRVGKLYSEEILDLLGSKDVHYYEVQDGEEYKSVHTAYGIYDYLIENNFDRNSIVITLGGGVICDLGGYIASTFMRGIDFLQVPTSLLAQVDASIGGKVAVNHHKGKNLIGSFYQPIGVLIDTDFLKTLTPREIKAGLGEIIKHSFLDSSDHVDFLRKNSKEILNLDPSIITEVIYRSCKFKRDLVVEDFKEKGRRALLNLGHSYGHVLEAITNYKSYSHGEAVAKGIIFELMVGNLQGIVSEDLISHIKSIFEIFEIDSNPIKIERDTLIQVIKKDKKNIGGSIIFAVISSIGTGQTIEVSTSNILEVNSSIHNRYFKGVVDIGTNSCRLFVSEVEEVDGNTTIVTPILKELEMNRLGEGVDSSKTILNTAIQRTVLALSKYREICRGVGVVKELVFATSATRDAKNRDEFIGEVFEKTGFKIECISGEVEGSLSFTGGTLDLEKGPFIVFDIGGGSTEVIFGDKGNIKFKKSFDVGSVRCSEKFFKEDRYTKESIKDANTWIKNILSEIKDLIEDGVTLVGVAGTCTTQVSVSKKMEDYNSSAIHLSKLDRKIVEDNLELFLNTPSESRGEIIGLHPKRSRVIIGGTLILLGIFDLLNSDSIIVSDKDILEGMMVGC